MNFIERVLQPGEKVVYRGRLHWIIYVPGIVLLVAGAATVGWRLAGADNSPALYVAGALVAAAGLFLIVRAWFAQWITQIAVTNLRVIYKRGFIRRYTVEMSMTKVESVTINQSIGGRIFDYGTIHVRGVGVGIEHLHQIDSPIALRNAIVVH